ncbi:VOC family protein [Xanthobacter sp. ZOL 2024]
MSSDPAQTFKYFSVFALADNFAVGLQSKHTIDPKPPAAFGGFELSFSNATNEQVDDTYREWKSKGINIVLEPTMLDFGYTFVASDPDGHRLRVCATDTTNVS